MKPELEAWRALNTNAAALLRPGFAERTLRAARAVAPTMAAQCALSAATAAICLLVIFFVHARVTAHETERNLAGWQEIAFETEQLGRLR